MATFKTEVCLVNKYGDFICRLERDGGYWKVPAEWVNDMTTLLDIGDEYKVVEIETEVE